MAQDVRKLDQHLSKANIVIGGQLVDVVTGGMYNDPLMVLREYVQNAVDSLDLAYKKGDLGPDEGRVDIRIDGFERVISVTDNGVGVPIADISTVLCSLGCSTKDRNEHRGFRGIGRLGGLGYCDQLIFETRASKKEPVSIVSWDGMKLQELNGSRANQVSAEKTLQQSVSIAYRRPEENDPASFFRATMRNVRRFHLDDLMNPKTVAEFLARVAPVDFDDTQFKFGREIRQHVSQIPGYRTYRIFLNDEQVRRPHSHKIILEGKKPDDIKEIKLFDVHSSDGQIFGRGWYGVTSFQCALPSQVAMRGIRVRQGNIEIGDEYSLANLYSERRFATWHIGEVHLDNTVKANARRDGFEQSPTHEAFLEQISFLCRQLSSICRESSKKRSKEKASETAIDRLEGLLRLRVVIDRKELQRAYEQAELRLKQLAAIRYHSPILESLQVRLEEAKNQLNGNTGKKPIFSDLLDGRSLRFAEPKNVLRDIARAIIANYDGRMSKERLLSVIFAEYLKRGALKELIEKK